MTTSPETTVAIELATRGQRNEQVNQALEAAAVQLTLMLCVANSDLNKAPLLEERLRRTREFRGTEPVMTDVLQGDDEWRFLDAARAVVGLVYNAALMHTNEMYMRHNTESHG